MVPAAWADESDRMPSLPEGPYSLTVSLHKTDPAVTIDGAEIAVFKAADLAVEGGSAVYTLTEAYALSGISFGGMTASESENAAEILEGLSGAASGRGTTDTDGTAVFTGLSAGMYLVTETGKSGTAAGYESFIPFLVSVPEAVKSADGNAWNVSVAAEPKTAVKAIPTATPTPAPVGGGGSGTLANVRTGDAADPALWTLLLTASAAVLAAAKRRNGGDKRCGK